MKTQHTKTYGEQLKQCQRAIAMVNACITKEERSQINNLNFNLETPGKEVNLKQAGWKL